MTIKRLPENIWGTCVDSMPIFGIDNTNKKIEYKVFSFAMTASKSSGLMVI